MAIDPFTPFCHESACVSCEDDLCEDGVCNPSLSTPDDDCPAPSAACVICRPDAEGGCPEATPWCDAVLGCTAQCTRHEQCPASACDLAQGTCIPPVGAVARVDDGLGTCQALPGGDWGNPNLTYCDLQTALDDAPSVAVIRLRAVDGGYRGPFAIGTVEGPIVYRTVVLMAEPGDDPVLLRAAGTDDEHVLSAAAGTRLYLQGLELKGVGEYSEAVGLDCHGQMSEATSAWLDDVEVHALQTGIRSVDCDLHLRRARIHHAYGEDGAGGIGVDVLGHSVSIESSVVALNEGSGVRADTTFLELRFSSLLGNGASSGLDLECLGTTTGRLETSLLLQSESSDSTIDCGSELILDRTVVLDYEALDELFSSVELGALSEAGANALVARGLVAWQPCDPYFDVEGQARPRLDRPGVMPGANEP